MKKIEFTIETFVDFLKTNIVDYKLKNLMVIVDYFYASKSGCACNRNKRIQALNDIYLSKILNLDTSVVEEIKKQTDSEEIVFKNASNEIIKSF